ncbi:IS3 family transposase [Halovulum sp. GXIMD14794]
MQRKVPQNRSDEEALTAGVIESAWQQGRHGCRRIAAQLWQSGLHVNHKRVARRALVRHRSEDYGARG